jgi:hypothetical protein
LIYIAVGIVGGIATLIFLIWVYYSLKYPILRKEEPGFKYVYVENDGSARELSEEDQVYLTTIFHPTDGARPYIKSDYKQRTPDGRVEGFIERRRVPKKIAIKKL